MQRVVVRELWFQAKRPTRKNTTVTNVLLMIATQLKQHQRDATHRCTVLFVNVKQLKHNYQNSKDWMICCLWKFQNSSKTSITQARFDLWTSISSSTRTEKQAKYRNYWCVSWTFLNSNKTTVTQENSRNQCVSDDCHTTQTALT